MSIFSPTPFSPTSPLSSVLNLGKKAVSYIKSKTTPKVNPSPALQPSSQVSPTIEQPKVATTASGTIATPAVKEPVIPPTVSSGTYSPSMNLNVPSSIPDTALSSDTTKGDVMSYRSQLEKQYLDYLNNQKTIQDRLLSSMNPSQEEINARNVLTNFDLGTQAGLNKIEDKPIAMEFITGQQASLARQASLERQGYASAYEALSNERKNTVDQLATQYEMLDKSLSTGANILKTQAEFDKLQQEALKRDTQIVKLDNGNTVLVDNQTGNIIKQLGGAKPADFTLGGTGNPEVDGWVNLISTGQATIAQVPAKIRTAVASGLSMKPSANKATALATVNTINQLLNIDARKNIAGLTGQFFGGLYGESATAKNLYNQVKGAIALTNREKLKGQGAVSDFEGRLLESASSALGRNLSPAEFDKQLKQIRGAISTSNGLTAQVRIFDPLTGQSQVVESDSLGIANAIGDGLTVTYE